MQLLTILFLLISTAACAGARDQCPNLRQQSLPVQLMLSSEVDETHVQAIRLAVTAVELQTGMKLFDLIETPRVSSVEQLLGRTVVQVFQVYPHSSLTQEGVTNAYFQDCRIFKATVDINAQYFKFYTGPIAPMANVVNLESLYLHELIHALGVDHSADEESVMFPILGYREYHMTLTQFDIDKIKNRYKGDK